eukprot:6580212-Alexandrium_andersonii.AAC.1
MPHSGSQVDTSQGGFQCAANGGTDASWHLYDGQNRQSPQERSRLVRGHRSAGDPYVVAFAGPWRGEGQTAGAQGNLQREVGG